jgi:1,4-dihydroxy-2-naphthoyl-CoA hydrolase
MTTEKTIWFVEPTKELYDQLCKNTAMTYHEVEFVEAGDNFLVLKMPVDSRTHQPFGLLHGGMSVMLAESVASWAAGITVNPEKYRVVGQEINANHLKSVKSGWVYGKASPIHIGRKSQVWEVRITDEQDNLVCVSRMTAAVLEVK